MIDSTNIYFLPLNHHSYDKSFEEELDQIYQNAKAVNFRVKYRLRSCFNKMNTDELNRIELQHRFLQIFKQGIVSQKADRIKNIFKARAIKNIQWNWQTLQKKKQRSMNMFKKMEEYRNKVILQQWKLVITVQKQSKILILRRKQQFMSQFILILRQNKQAKIIKVLQSNQIQIQEFSYHKIKHKTFQSLVMNTKISKLTKTIKQKSYFLFKKQCQTISTIQKNIVQSFKRKYLIKKAFISWKQIYHCKLAEIFNSNKLMSQCFNVWKNSLDIMAAERQIQLENQCIVNIFIERSRHKMMKKILKKWNKYVTDLQDNRYKKEILNNYADKKRKQLLLSRYFQKLKLHFINGQVQNKYYFNKLKRKVIDGLKVTFRKAVDKEDKVIEFMQKRQIRKYFLKIKQFNESQEKKIMQHRKRIVLNAFGESIIKNYCQRKKKADDFLLTNLSYKVLIGLRKQVIFRKKSEYVIGYLNVIRPLRKWNKSYLVNKFILEREWFKLKNIFSEWRVTQLKKSAKKKYLKQSRIQQNMKEKHKQLSQQKLQQFQFQNIMATITKIRNNLAAQKQQRPINNFGKGNTIGDSSYFGEALSYSDYMGE